MSKQQATYGEKYGERVVTHSLANRVLRVSGMNK
jgi:hypothetical protein